jgi:hypothetical protein
VATKKEKKELARLATQAAAQARYRAKRTAEKVADDNAANAKQMADARAIEGHEPETRTDEWGHVIGDPTGLKFDIRTQRPREQAPVEYVSRWYPRDGYPGRWGDVCPYQDEEKRWVFYCLRQITHTKWADIKEFDYGYGTREMEEAAEARGSVIHDRLLGSPVDALRVARGFRAGRSLEDLYKNRHPVWEGDQLRYTFPAQMTRERVEAALNWLQRAGILGWINGRNIELLRSKGYYTPSK